MSNVDHLNTKTSLLSALQILKKKKKEKKKMALKAQGWNEKSYLKNKM